MADTERLMNKAQGDDIISALATIAANILQVPSEKLIIDWSYTTLPASGNDHTIYAIPTGDADDPWDFYVWNDTDEEWVQFDWNFAVDSTLSTTSENPVQNKVVTEALNGKVDAVTGKGLSTNDYTNDDKASVASSAEQLESTQTATGNPLTLTDCAPINAESLVVELEPKQDLHGQSAPYVGGAGKNILNPNFSAWTLATPYLYLKIPNFNDETYIMSFVDKDTSIDISGISIGFMNNYPESNTEYRWALYDGSVEENRTNVSIRNAVKCDTIIIYRNTETVFNKLFARYDIQVEKGSVSTSFAPYENICPITGYTQTSVEGCGKNLFDVDGELSVYDINAQGTQRAGYKLSLHAGTYTASAQQGGSGYYLDISKSDSSGITSIGRVVSGSTITPQTFTLTAETELLIFDAASAQTNIAKNRFDASQFQIEKGSTATTYEPYASTHATIPFSQTLYGGVSDFVEGGTSDDRTSIDLGDLSWNKVATVSGKWRFEAALYDFKKFPTGEAGTFLCSAYPTVSASDTWQGTFGLSGNGNYNSICVCDMSYSDVTAFSNAMDGVQLVYELATPTTLSTPPTPLKLLQGTNNLSADGVMQIGYQPDNVIGELKGDIQAITEMDYLRILDNNVETPVNNYRIYYHLIVGPYTLVNMAEMLQHRFIFVEVIQNPSGTYNHNLLHSALIDPRSIDGFKYQMKATVNDNIWIESNLDENKFYLALGTTGGSYSDGDPTDYYVTIRMVD